MDDILHTIILVLHVIGATIIVGSSFASLIALIKKRISKDNLKLVGTIWKLAGPALGIQLLTGLYLAGSEWDKFGGNPLFWTKMVLFIINALMGTLVLQKQVKNGLQKGKDTIDMSQSLRFIWISFIIFLLIVTLGVFLAEGASE